jgi:hypothetical protein
MPETHLLAQFDQAGRLGRPGRGVADAESRGGTPQQGDVADRLGRRRQQQLPGLPRKRTSTALTGATFDVDGGPDPPFWRQP